MEYLGLKENPAERTKSFALRHTVSLSETNAMGGVVYFSNFVKWQGVARELILQRELDYKKLMAASIDMITHSCSIKFLGHLYFGDVVRFEIQTAKILPMSFVMLFEYFRDDNSKIVATGDQKVTFANSRDGNLCRIPSEIYDLVKRVEVGIPESISGK